MGRMIKKILGTLTVLAMMLSVIPAVYADTSCNVELSNIEYVLKKGTREVNLSVLSNKMEVRVKVKNTSNSSQNIRIRVDGYKSGKKVAEQTRYSDSFDLTSGAISDVKTVKLSNIKAYCDTINVFAVTGSAEKKIASFPYISLGIKLNGKELEAYSDDKDEYTAVLDTPYPYFEITKKSSKQKDLNKGFDYKLPYTRVITVSQTGKDEAHKLKDRKITIKMETTSPTISHISNENMIFWADATTNNTDKNIYDYSASVWSDLSGYNNDIDKVYDVWTSKGLKVTTKWYKNRLTQLPQKVADTINSGNYTIKFTPTAINEVSGSNLSLMGSDNENFRIFIKKDSGKIYFKWGDATFTPEMASVNISDAEGKENAITVSSDGTVNWYVDGIKKSQKTYSLTGHNSVSNVTLSDVKEGNIGSVVFSELKVFDKALSQSEIQESDILNQDTTMEVWYSNVDNGIALCGRLKSGTDTINSTNVKYFCLPNDSFAESNATEIASELNKKIDSAELSEDFTSYNKIAKLAEGIVISAKTVSGNDITTDDIISYANSVLPERISGLVKTIDDSALAAIKSTVNSSNIADEDTFEDLVTKQLIIASITSPKNYAPLEVAGRIISYSHDLGLNLHGFASANSTKKSQIALSIVSTKPNTVSEIEAIIVAGLSTNQQSENNTGAGAAPTSGGTNVSGGGGGGGLPTTPSSHQSQQPTIPTVTIAGFNDMSGSEWVGTALEYMVSKGYVSGVGDNKFAPHDNITRSEFVAIIARCEGFEITEESDSIFDDVPTDFWGYKNIMSAYKNGIISGVGERTFNPGGNITRQDIAVILYNVYERYAQQEDSDNNFSDWDNISDYAKEAVGKLHALKILNGYGTEFSPKGLCTRAEAVQAIYGYLRAVNR